MKRIIAAVLLSVCLAQAAFGACEDETAKRDKQKKLTDDWGKTSETGAGLGCIIGGCVAGLLTANPVIIAAATCGGGLVGGGVPGGVCLRMKALLDYREEVLRVCLENDKNTKLIEAENQRQALINQHAQSMGACLSSMFRRKYIEYQIIASQEANDRINYYIDNDLDTSDPLIRARLDAELRAIEDHYGVKI